MTETTARLCLFSGPLSMFGAKTQIAALENLTPQMFAGSPWEAEYKRVNPNPDGFPNLVKKIAAMEASLTDWPESDMQAIKAPTLVISADADVVRPEHFVAIYRLRGGGPSKDFMTALAAELAILPGTAHLGIVEKADLVTQFAVAFFDKPIK